MALVMSSTPTRAGSYVSVARSMARLTLTSWTPGTSASPFSIRATQLAQVIPWTGRSMRVAVMHFPPRDVLDLERESSQLNKLQEHHPQPDHQGIERHRRPEGEQPEHEQPKN